MIDISIAKIERKSNIEKEETIYQFNINNNPNFTCSKRELLEVQRSITRFFKEVENTDTPERI
ncbi:MAG: hypothetical protein LUG98_14140 [Tannerellaceae bacterium]|nr:hypothetical protein [Tannerellaceae bacterium]